VPRSKIFVQGDLLEVTVTWAAAKREYGIDEAIIDSTGKPIQVRFGGNIQNALEYKAVEKRNEVTFKANGRVLPPDGTLVMIKVKAKK
jgi:cytochrome c oxidase assembly protein Cox11